ncbi:F-box/kelch-repeat protein [Trifolium pratense]|uniref:F-box/kelch-repeat protein n=1 Tax=Trifolium pratense TaxID=57577 RepID=A0A2K3P6H7_TRIPR|nr:F-box/kelch-repeat protein [Trifolium pratense]
MEKKATPFLPLEMIIQILLWLPVKSLIRFKSVCKLWFSVISDPNFANSHFLLAQTNSTRIVSISAAPPQIRSIDFEALLNDGSASPNPNLWLPQSYFPLQMKGSCRGFIFLHCSSNNYLWNPSTGFHKQIPLSPIDSRFGAYFHYLYGFGYDQSRDDYLVVLLSYDPAVPAHFKSHLEIFSLTDNTWKKIEDTRIPYRGHYYYYYYPKVGLLFNGAIHWLVTHHGSSVTVIVAFDLMERKLLEITLPYSFVGHHCVSDIGLWVFGEFLSLWAMTDGIVEIWVMKQFTVHYSWTKTHVFPIGAIPYFSPIYSTKNGDIIGTIDGTGLVKYNGQGQMLGHCSYCDDPRGSQVVMYTESLLSLPGDHEQV